MVLTQHRVSKWTMSGNSPTLSDEQQFTDILKQKIADEFCRYVQPIPMNRLLKHRRVLLDEKEQNELKAVAASRGRWKACEFLLNCLTSKKKWFKYLIRVLRNPDIKLDFLADRFVHYKWMLLQQSESKGMIVPETPTQIGEQPFYDVLKHNIADEFCGNVEPITLNRLLKHRRVLLTESEQEELKAIAVSSGPRKACEFLLDSLASKEKWFKYLIIVLRDPASGLDFLADFFENERDKLMESYYSNGLASGSISYRPQASSMDQDLPICCGHSGEATQPSDPSSIDVSQTRVKTPEYTRL